MVGCPFVVVAGPAGGGCRGAGEVLVHAHAVAGREGFAHGVHAAGETGEGTPRPRAWRCLQVGDGGIGGGKDLAEPLAVGRQLLSVAASEPLRWSADAGIAGEGDRGGAAGHAQLQEHAGDVVLYRLDADPQLEGDGVVGGSVGHPFQHVEFPLGELRE